jgi:hypothetical protein
MLFNPVCDLLSAQLTFYYFFDNLNRFSLLGYHHPAI